MRFLSFVLEKGGGGLLFDHTERTGIQDNQLEISVRSIVVNNSILTQIKLKILSSYQVSGSYQVEAVDLLLAPFSGAQSRGATDDSGASPSVSLLAQHFALALALALATL